MWSAGCWCLVLLSSLFGLLGCLSLPEQPSGAQPYARLVLPEAIRLVGIDSQSVDSRARLQDLQVTPGLHRFRFVYAGDSPRHTGQQNDPFALDMTAGHQYELEART